MQIIDKELNELIPYDKNPRNNEEAVEPLIESIKEFGFKCPIIIDKDNVIVAGHTRFKAAKKLKLKVVPCIVADDLTEEQIKAYRLADNKVSEFAEWDIELLEEELENILDIDMADFGFELLILNPDELDDNFELPDGDKEDLEQMTFTLHTKQAELIKYAIDIIINGEEIEETFGNSNKNGNALYEVVKQWAEQRK